jgi:hypothetical protein
MPEPTRSSYHTAHARNIGWVTAAEQQLLRRKRIAIAGLGGVGGAHLLTLARLGVGGFHIADLDRFDLPNVNRQSGAFMSTLGKRKTDVLAGMARDINADIELQVFDEGVTSSNVNAFLDGVDLYVDGLDFFAFSARHDVFAACEHKGVPAITAAPLGMGAALLTFMPGEMTFEDYFRWNGCSAEEKALRFLIGLSPTMLHRHYLVDRTTVNFSERRGPSTAMACELCAGMAATVALKLLLGRGEVLFAPRGLHFDAYRNKLVRTWRPGGNGNPLQRIALFIARRQLAGTSRSPVTNKVQTNDE